MESSAVEESERETVVRIADGKLDVFTSSLPMYRKLRKLGFAVVTDHSHSAWLQAPDDALAFRRVGRKKRQVSEATRLKLAERLKAARASAAPQK